MANKLSLYRGVTYPSRYYHKDGNGNSLPLTGCTVFFTIKNVEYDDVTDDTTSGNSLVPFKATITDHTDAANGITDWETLIPATGIPPSDDYYYDIVIQDADGKKLPPVLIGACEIKGKPTNRSA